MATFEGEVLTQTVAVARAHKIEPAALLAVVEVESNGKSMDGAYPCLLFERHVFYRELRKAGKSSQLDVAVARGLANSSWQPKSQYKDQGTSAKRVALFERAAQIDRECAIRSCSWGVGQTSGFLAEELNFTNAVEMLNYQISGGVPAQVECMVREVERKRLGAKLNAHQWAGFAKVYNGPSYEVNHYDDKMASSYVKWSGRKLPDATLPKPVVVPPEVRPAPPPPPQTPPSVEVATGGGLAGIATAAMAMLRDLPWSYIAFAVFIAVLVVATIVILWQRSKRKPQTGLLSVVEGET